MPSPHTIRVAPSLLAADFSRLADEIQTVEAGGVEILHLDVMDGHFVPNLTFGLPVIEAIRAKTKLFFDAHLMIQHPERSVQYYLDAGCDLVTVHCEAEGDPAAALDIVRAAGKKTGIAVNPETPFEKALPYAAEVDLILIMSVHPGFGGQKFMPEVLPKFKEARAAGRPGTWYEIDGGINAQTIQAAVGAGADLIIAGSAIYHADDPAAACKELRKLATAAPQ